MNAFNHNYYESNSFRDNGSVAIGMHGSRLKIKMHIPEQKIVQRVNHFCRKQGWRTTIGK